MAEFSTNLYDFNKAQMAQIEPLDEEWLVNHCQEVALTIWDEVYDREPEDSQYWMLLCRERNDFTIFVIKKDPHDFGDAIYECLKARGDIIDFTPVSSNYEIWIRDPETKENFVYYLFDYSLGVVEV